MTFYKPIVNIFSKEFYIVGQGYQGIDQKLLDKMIAILENYSENSTLYETYPSEFIYQLLVVNNKIIENYLFNFRRQIYYVDNLEFMSTSQKELVEKSIMEKNKEWIVRTKIKKINIDDKL